MFINGKFWDAPGQDLMYVSHPYGIYFQLGSRPGKTVQMSEAEVRGLCLKSREIFLSQPILLELEAPLKICGKILLLLVSMQDKRSLDKCSLFFFTLPSMNSLIISLGFCRKKILVRFFSLFFNSCKHASISPILVCWFKLYKKVTQPF